MNKVTRILISSVAVGLITATGIAEAAMPLVHAESISEHVQSYSYDFSDNPYDDPFDAADVDLFQQNLTDSSKSVRADNYAHKGEYVYVRITPISDKFDVKIKEDVAGLLDNYFVLDSYQDTGSPSSTRADFVLKATDTRPLDNNVGNHIELKNGSWSKESHTIKLAVGTGSGGIKNNIRGVFVDGYGVYVEWFTYHQPYNG